MAERWYYAHDERKMGPCSAQQLKALAASGEILPTDTIWKEGIERGSLAQKVKHLFPSASDPVPLAEPPSPPQPTPDTPAVEAESAPAEPAAELGSDESASAEPQSEERPVLGPDAADAQLLPLEKVPEPVSPSSCQMPVKKGRATAGKGTVIVGQDGVNVKFRKKCTTCGHLDSSWHTMPIRNGVTRLNFYCQKCRKPRDAEIHGTLS
jgi:hypothetical protein